MDVTRPSGLRRGMANQPHLSDKALSSRLQSAADRSGDPDLKAASRRMQSVVDKREHQQRQPRGR
ncbi:hypothetical protein GCM10018953_59230 [Streptosporangium nondiastaticum]